MKPKISFVVPCYNEQEWLPKLLFSLNNCKVHFDDLEFVVVDNASTDKTVEVLWSLLPDLQFKVRLVHELSKGVSRARNTGARVARGDIFVFIDSDMRLTQSFVEHLMSVTSKLDFGGATIRTLAEPGSVKGTLLFYVLELIKMVSPKAFGKSVATRDDFKAVGGFDIDVRLGENVIFASDLKHHAKTTRRKFYHIHSPIYCSLRRFEKLRYSKVLLPWLLAYFGKRNLPYKTIDEL